MYIKETVVNSALQHDSKKAFSKGLRDGIPICLGYLSVSFAFGVMCTENGLPFWVAVLISMTNLTSAGQFAGTGLILAGGGFVEIAVTTFVINIRYMLMSLSLSQKADPAMTTGQRLLLSMGITDEVFGVCSQQKGTLTAAYMAGLIFLPYFGWAFGTLAGSTITGLLPAMVRSALGIAIYGMFMAIIVPPSKQLRPIAVTVILAACLSILISFLPLLREISAGWRIILCAVLASLYSAVRYPAPEEEASKA